MRRSQSQASAGWQWGNFLESLSPPEEKIVRINMDETSITFWQESKKGFVVVKPHVEKEHFLEAERVGQLSQRRGVCSLLASICDEFEIQQLLPQVLIVNKHTVTQAHAASVRNTLSQGCPCVMLHETVCGAQRPSLRMS